MIAEVNPFQSTDGSSWSVLLFFAIFMVFMLRKPQGRKPITF